jgi:hypothetical protein
MQVVVPLAGPDLIRPDGSIKPLDIIDGQPSLEYILKSRPWFKKSKTSDYVFILSKNDTLHDFYKQYLVKWFPGCRVVFISNYSSGAAMSCLAGTALLKKPNDCLIIDLADIYYEGKCKPQDIFLDHPNLDVIVPCFESQKSFYSYININQNGNFIEAKEKEVISKYATAGTYIFRNLSSYLECLSWMLINGCNYKYNNLYYICPVLNFYQNSKNKLKIELVNNVIDLKV